jgi:hypothetical protein
VLADAVHHQLGLRYDLAAPVTGFAVGHTAEHLRAVLAGEPAARKLSPDQKAQRVVGHYRGFSRTVECERRAQILDRSTAQALLVVPGLPLGIPDLEAVNVKTKRSPIIRANQAHPVSRGDREPAPIAGMSEAVTVPQLNRAVTRKVAVFDPVPNEVPNRIGDHIDTISILIFPINRHLPIGSLAESRSLGGTCCRWTATA